MKKSGKFPKPHPDYRCPLCPDHEDDVFVWRAILDQPICDGCDYELWDAVVCDKSQLAESYILDSLEKATDLPFDIYPSIEPENTVSVISEQPQADQETLAGYKEEIVRLKSRPSRGGA